MREDLFIDVGALIGLISGIWMIYYKINMAPGLNDIDPYCKGKSMMFIPRRITLCPPWVHYT
jgi:hypothetical protein